MKKITLTIFMGLLLCCTIWQMQAQQETTAKASRASSTLTQPPPMTKALDAVIYDTTHSAVNGVELTPAGNPNHSMGDAIVLSGSERLLTSVTVDLFNLASTANYDLTISIYTDCPSSGAAGSACGTGPGVFVSTHTQSFTSPGIGFVYSQTLVFPSPVDLSSEVDNNITVVLSASRNDVFWIINETPVVGSIPPGDPATSFVIRCGSSGANNGCARNFGVQNNFAMTLVADGPTVECGTSPLVIPAGAPGTTSGQMTPSIAAVTDVGVIGVNPGEYALDNVTLNINHTWADDLEIVLISPAGTRASLTSDNGGSAGLDVAADLVFTDASSNNVASWDSFVPLADYRAEGGGNTFPVAAGDGPGIDLNTVFAGESITGNWTIEINDDVGGDTGQLNSYCISFVPLLGMPPVILCPADVMAFTDPGACGAVVNYADAVALDFEDGPIGTTQISGPLVSGDEFPTGDTVVTFEATDSDGNTVQCSFTITVTDGEDPVAVCQDITVEVDPVTGMVSILPSDIDNGSTDNCGVDSLSLDIDTFTCADIGVNVVTLTVTDVEGNSSTCMANVTVEDNTAPVVVCIGEPATLTGGDGTSPNLAIPDNTPAGVTSTLSVADDFDITDLNVDLVVTHTWVGDLIVTLESPAGTVVTIVDQMGVPNSTFGCSSNDLDIVLDDEAALPIEDECQAGSPAASGSFIPNNALSAFDGESTMGDWILTISDVVGGDTGTLNSWGITYDYQVAATALDVILDANGMATIDASDLLLSVEEACGWVATVGGPATSVDVTECGNAPEDIPAGAPGNTSGPMNPSIATVTDVGVVGTNYTIDNVAVNLEHTWASDLVVTLESPNGLTLNLMTQRGGSSGLDVAATLVFTDDSVNDVTLWTSNANGPLADYQAEGGLFNTVFAGEPVEGDWTLTIDDLAGGDFGVMNSYCITFSSVVDTTVSFDCSQLGENLVEVFVTDASGNVASCFATVNVIDDTDPILVCVDATIELGPDGTATIDPTDLLGTTEGVYGVMVIGSDNASGFEGFTDFTVNVTEAAAVSFDWDYTSNDDPGWDSFGYLLNGVYTQLTDPGQGNQSGSGAVAVNPGDVFGFRSQTDDNLLGNNETVISNFLPGFEGQFAQDNWTLTLLESNGDAYFVELIPPGPLSFDACGITVLAVDVTEVTCADIGAPIIVTVFASDASGNIAACNSTITVVDLLAPELTCPADQTVDPGPGNLFYEVPDYFANGEATATDNCTDPVVLTTQDPAAGTLLPDGVYTVTITAEDEYGNVSTCDFELTIESILGVDDNLDAALAIYPNPANSQVTISNSSNIALNKAAIYDINGKLVMNINLQDMQTEKVIDISRLASGVYMVQISGEQANVVKRLVKR